MKQEKVIDRAASRTGARVDCQRNSSQSSSQSGYIHIPCSQTTGARARVREGGTAIRCREAYFRAWRIAKFGGDFDPIRRAVDEAVAAFSFYKDEAGREDDRFLWLKIANRVGLDAIARSEGCCERKQTAWDVSRSLRAISRLVTALLNKTAWLDDESESCSIAERTRDENKREFESAMVELAEICRGIAVEIGEALS